MGILPQYTLNNLVDCSIFLGDPWVTLWYTWETAEISLYTFRILGRLRILIRILKNLISGKKESVPIDSDKPGKSQALPVVVSDDSSLPKK